MLRFIGGIGFGLLVVFALWSPAGRNLVKSLAAQVVAAGTAQADTVAGAEEDDLQLPPVDNMAVVAALTAPAASAPMRAATPLEVPHPEAPKEPVEEKGENVAGLTEELADIYIKGEQEAASAKDAGK